MSDTDTLPRTSTAVAEECRSTADKLADLRSVAPDKRDDKWAAELRETSNALVDLDREHQTRSHLEDHEMRAGIWAAALEAGIQEPGSGPQAGTRQVGGGETRTPGDIVVESEVFKAAAAGGEMRGFGEVEVRNLISIGTVGGSGADAFAPVGQPVPPIARQRRLFIEDLLSSQQTGLTSVPYIRELNPATNETGSSTVAEASAKTEVIMAFESADAPIRKIAAWIQVTMEALQDAPTLAGYINTRLSYMILLESEDQILNGDGNAPNLRGIIGATGVQTQTATNNDVPATVADAIAKVELVDGDPDGVAMNPGDFWASVSERRSTHFDGEAHPVNGSPFGTPNLGLWGLPVVRTRALTSLTALVGSFRLGGTVFERMGVTIRSTDSHASLFISNTAVVLAERRLGLALHRPDFFVTTTLDITA